MVGRELCFVRLLFESNHPMTNVMEELRVKTLAVSQSVRQSVSHSVILYIDPTKHHLRNVNTCVVHAQNAKVSLFCLLQKSYITNAITSAKYLFLVEHGEHSQQARKETGKGQRTGLEKSKQLRSKEISFSYLFAS